MQFVHAVGDFQLMVSETYICAVGRVTFVKSSLRMESVILCKDYLESSMEKGGKMMRMRGLKYVEELERRYAVLENKCKIQEIVIESLSKNYYKLKKERNRAAMHYWMYWFKMDDESVEDLEDNGWYLIIIPDCDYPVMAKYHKLNDKFLAFVPWWTRYIGRELVKYWAYLPEPDLFDAIENGGETE